MQIFQVNELKEFPYMEIQEITSGERGSDIINESNIENVYLLIDHDSKRIWTYNGRKSSFKLQIYGSKLANMMRTQLRLFYRVVSLNARSKEDDIFREVMEKELGSGRAKPFDINEFTELSRDRADKPILSMPSGVIVNEVINMLSDISQPEEFIRKFMIIGGIIFIEEEIVDSFVKEEKVEVKPVKLSKLNNGFTFFNDRNYSTRLIIKDRKVQSIELYVHEDQKDDLLELKIPLIPEDRFSKRGNLDKLINNFQIPNELPGDELSKEQSNSE